MKKKNILFVLAAICLSLAASAQKGREVTLSETTAMARVQSVDAAVALNKLKTSYWEYRTFRTDLLPGINLKGTLSNYNKSYGSYQNPDGSYSFVHNSALGPSGELSIDQNIWPTDGQLSLTSPLDYLKQLGNNGDRHLMSVLAALKLIQPILDVNNMKRNRRIEPVRYVETKAESVTTTEEVTMRAITYYFDLLLARETLGTAHQNLTNASRFYEMVIAKHKMGQISGNELPQLKLSALNTKAALTEIESNLNAKMFQLRTLLGVGEDEILHPVVPESVDCGRTGYNMALSKALEHDSFAQNIRRRQLEAGYAVATTRGNLRSTSLFASVGHTGGSRELSSVHGNLQDDQIVQVGAQIPILGWGKRRGKVRVVKNSRDVVFSKIWQGQINFNQNVFLLVEHFGNQAQQLEIAKKTDGMAQQRYETNIETFLVSRISTLDSSDAQSAKGEARRKHIPELYYY